MGAKSGMQLKASERNKFHRNDDVSGAPPSSFVHLSRLLRGGRLTRWKGKVASCAPHVLNLLGVSSPQMLAVAIVAALATTTATAADRYWDANATAGGLGGAGVWNTSSSLWTQAIDGVSGPYGPWNNSLLDNAIFAGTAGTVTIGEPVVAHNLTFNVAGYTIAGSTLTLAGTAPTLSVVAGTTSISSAIAGAAGLTMAGPGTLRLTGSNTFSGGLTVNSGFLSINGDAALGAAGNGVTLAANGSVTFVSDTALATTRVVTLSGTGTAYLGGGVGSARFTGNGELRVSANNLTLSNDTNDYTGATTLQGGGQTPTNLTFGSIANAGVASALGKGSAVNVQAGGYTNATATYTGGAVSTDRSWVISSAGATGILQNRGLGTLTLTGNIATFGNAALSAATADINASGVISGSGTVSFTGAAGRSITLTGASTYTGPTFINGTTAVASSLADAGTASALGQGTQVTLVNGVLTYAGAGNSSNRSITLSGLDAIASSGTGALALTGPLTFGAGGPLDSLTLGGTYAGVNTISGVIANPGSLVMNGAAGNVWQLNGANTFTGTTTVQGGTLRLGNAAALGNNTGAIVNGGTLDLNAVDTTVASLAGTGGSVALTAGADLTVSGTSNTSYAGGLTGDGGLTKAGTGTQTLTGQSTYTGATTINGGTLALNFTAAGAPASNIISPSSTLNMAGGTLSVTGTGQAQSFAATNVTAGNNTISGSGNTTLNLGAINRTNGLLNFILPGTGSITTTPSTTLGGWATVSSGAVTDYAQVDGAGNIVARTAYATKDDASSWVNGDVVSDTANNPNTPYFGTVNGNVQLGGLKYTAAAPSTVTVAGTLGVDGTIIASSSVGANAQTITGGQLTGPAGGGTLGVLQNNTGNFTIASTIVDNGGATGFTKAGTGLVTLSGVNTYTGATAVSGGTLAVNSIANAGQASAIGAASADPSNLLLEGATLKYTGGTTSTDRGFTVATNGAVTNGTVEVSQTGTNLTFSGLVTSPDEAGLTKTGPGTLTLANPANTYVGPTTISGGILAAATLANGGQSSSIGASTSDPANLLLQNGGTLQYTGGTTGSDRGFTLGAGGGGIGVNDGTATLTMSGTATGAGGLTKSGPGTLVLSGTNTYTGGTTVSAGTLRAGSSQAFGGLDASGTSAGAMNVLAGATLDLASNNTTVGGLTGAGTVTLGSATLRINNNGSGFSGAISGTGGVTIAGGTQVMTGCGNSYTGATVISGTLSVSCLRNGGQSSDVGASSSASGNLQIASGTLSYTGDSVTTDRGVMVNGVINVAKAGTTLEFSGVVAGRTLSKTGPGTLVLSGANTYGAAGATLVNGGILRAGSTSAFGISGLRMDTTGATLDLNNFDNTVAYISQINTAITGGNITLGSATLTVNGGGGVYNGAISGTGGLVKTGAGTQTLSGAASSYTGSTIINSGGLSVTSLANGGSNSSIGASTAAPGNLVLNGGTLQYVGTGATTDRQFTLGPNGGALDASGTGALNFASTAPVALSGSGNRTLTLTGTSTAANSLVAGLDNPGGGTTSLTKTGTGTWILRNPASTYTGVTTISGGVLGVDKLANGGQASSLGASTSAATNLVIGNGSTLRYTGTGDTTDRLFSLDAGVTIIESSGTGALVFANTGNVTLNGTDAAHTIALGGTNTGNNTMGGTIVDDGAGKTILAKNDSGTWILTGNNTYTGNTVVNDGTLVVGNGGTSGNAGAGNVIVYAPTSALAVNRSDAFDFNGTLSGAGAFEQRGTGTTRLTAAGSSIGATRITGGTLQVDGSLSTATLAMSNTSALTVNGTVQGAGGTALALSGDGGNSSITVNAGGTLRAQGDLGGGSDTLTLSATTTPFPLLDTAGGTLSLGAGNDTLVLDNNGDINGARVDGGTGIDTIQVNNTSVRGLSASTVQGFEALNKTLNGTLFLTGDHTYSAGVTIAAGVLQVGDGAAPTSLSANVANNGTLSFNVPGAYTFGGTVSGSGAVRKVGTGTTVLTGTNSYAGATSVLAGTLLIDGDQTAATGATTVASGATLGGKGTLGGAVTVADGATLSPGDVAGTAGTLTIKGDLALGAASTLAVDFGRANEVGGTLNDLVNVGGNLTLGGTIQVNQTTGGTFGPGLYRIASYGGTLSDLGTTVSPSSGLILQKSVAGQVNLVNTNGATLNFWDGDAGPQNNSQINGGNGTWRAAGDFNWTDNAGAFNASFSNGSMAVFAGTPGTVTVDTGGGAAPVNAAGMQFASDGYVITGDAIGLAGTQAAIRVGDGSSAGAGYTATIDAPLTGTAQLAKTDLGKLVLSGTNTYTGGTQVDQGTLSISSDANLGDAGGALTLNGGTLQTTASLGIDRTVTLTAASTFATDGGTTATLTGALSGAGALTKDGAGTLVLQTDDTRTGGTTIAAGTLQVGGGGTVGTLAGDVVDNGTLSFSRSDTYTYDGTISGTGAVQQTGTGTTVLTADQSYSGGTTISSGTLQLGAGGTSGMVAGNITDNGTLSFNRADQITFNGTLSGTGSVRQDGTGTTILTAANTHGGATTVSAGRLLIEGDQSLATGATAVNAGTLGGTGIIGGDVAVAAGATIAPGGLTVAPGTLTIKGGLNLDPSAQLAFNFGQANVVGGPYNDLIDVGGDLTLGGNLTVTQSPGGNFGPGLYRVISYGGTLTDQGLTVTSPDYTVQTAVARQVNLVNSAGVTLNYWDGDGGPKLNGQVDGGAGTWRVAAGDDDWADQTGQLNAPYTNGSFAVFAGTGDRVTVDNTGGAVQASGMQFASDGYRIEGGDIGLVGAQAIIRVGDGTLPGAGYTATIASNLTGSSQIVKEDLGTLVLSGTNTYTGGTLVQHGTLSISSDANLGDVSGALTVADGTLRTTADMTLARSVALTGAATFLTDPGTTAVLGGALTGAGSLTKTGAGTLALAGDATHTGGTTIAAGTLQVGAGGSTGSLAGDVTNNGTLAFDRSDTYTYDGIVSGTGALLHAGTGTTILTAGQAYTGGTTIAAGVLQLGNGGASGMIAGDVTSNGTLAFNRSDAVSFAGTITGTGSVTQQGSGTTSLTAANAYKGSTTVNGGSLLIQGDQSLATGTTTVNAGTLGGTGIVGGDVSVASGATLAPGAAPGNPGTFTIKGSLALNAGANLAFDFGQHDVVGGGLNDLIKVGGDVSLGGTLNVTSSMGGSFGPGLYRVISYDGNLVPGGTLALATQPAGMTLQVQTAIAHQVNLAVAATTPLTYWDGDAGGRDDNQVAGGNGTWRASGDDNWVSGAGTTNGPYTNGGFPIFAATPGTVTVDRSQGDVRVSGMQFASNGYTVQGDAIVLEGAAASVRVGDGTSDGAGYVATINAPLTGSGGLAKADLGTLVLGGASDYTGATAVAGGTLVVNGSIARSAVSVQNGAVLGGDGTVGSTIVATGATVAPGTSLGTLSVAGNYAQASGAVYQAQVDPTSNASDRIAVSGTATLADGAVLNVTKTSDAPYSPTARYTVLTANGGLNGTFALTGDTALSSFLALGTAYDANNAYLVVQQSRAIDTVAQSRNQGAAARGVDSLPVSNGLKTAVLNLPSDAAARAALDQLSGEIHASVQTASLQDSHFVRDAATDRLRETFCAVGSQTDKRDSAPRQDTDCEADSLRPDGWVRVFGGWQHTRGDGDAATMSDSIGGVFAGADTPLSDHWRVGAMTGYSRTDIDVNARDSSASSDNYHLGVYAGAVWGALGLRTGVAYTWQDVSTRRSVNFAGFSDHPSASYNAGTAQVFGDLGYHIDADRYALEPFVNVAYVKQRTDGFTEDGGAAALRSPGDRTDVTFSTLGSRVSTAIMLGSMEGTLRGSLGWRHAFGGGTPVSTLALQGGTQFGVAGVPLAQDAAVVDAGLDMSLSKNASLGVSYSAQFAGRSKSQSVQATLKVMF